MDFDPLGPSLADELMEDNTELRNKLLERDLVLLRMEKILERLLAMVRSFKG